MAQVQRLEPEEYEKKRAEANIHPPRKPNRHVVIALNRMNKRRTALIDQRAKLTKEIEELDAAILAL